MSAFHDNLPNPVQKRGEPQVVKTPVALVSRIIDGFPADVWSDRSNTWLVPVSKTGVFELEIYVRLMRGLAEVIPNWEERRAWIVNEMIWSFTPTAACELVIRRNYLGKVWNSMGGFDKLEGNVQTCNFLKLVPDRNGEVMAKKSGKWKLVKFKCVAGNPPYQKKDGAGGGGASAGALYPDFVEKAMDLKPKYLSMVIPTPWLNGNGKGTGSFLEKVLGSKRLTNIVSTEKSEEWFPGVLLPGGVMFFMMEASKKDSIVKINGVDTDLSDQEVILVDHMGMSISGKVLNKLREIGRPTFNTRVCSSNVYGIRSFWDTWSDDPKASYVCHTKGGAGGGEVTKLIDKKQVTKKLDTISKWKLCIPKAYGAERGSTGNTFLVKPGAIVTETYLVIGVFNTEQEAKNAEGFIKTYLAQYLVSLLKVKNTSQKTFKFVPYLDFTRSYSNQDLYSMFGLTKEEIAHVENTTRNYIVFRASNKHNGKSEASNGANV